MTTPPTEKRDTKDSSDANEKHVRCLTPFLLKAEYETYGESSWPSPPPKKVFWFVRLINRWLGH